MTLEEFARTLGLLAGIFISLGILAKAAYTLWKFGRMIHKLFDWVEEIYHQFKPNDGHSLADHVGRIDRNSQVNARNIQTVYGVILKGLEFDPNDALLLEPLEAEPERKNKAS